MRKPIAQRIAELEDRKRSLVARLGKQERARDTRRKILIGTLVLDRLGQQSHPANARFADHLRAWLGRELPRVVTRDSDRALFSDLLEPGLDGRSQIAHNTPTTDQSDSKEDR